MKKSEFKKVNKPLIEEAVREVLFQPGVLSRVINEVATSMSGNQIVENSDKEEDLLEKQRIYEQKRQEKIKRLNESTKLNSSVFEGVSEIPEKSSNGALSGVSPSDSGVDISGITKLAGGSAKWKSLIGK